MKTFNVLYAFKCNKDETYLFEIKNKNQYQWFIFKKQKEENKLMPLKYVDMGEHYRIFEQGRLDFALGDEKNLATYRSQQTAEEESIITLPIYH